MGKEINRIEVDFNGNLLALLEIKNNEIIVLAAINGWGDKIDLDKIKINQK